MIVNVICKINIQISQKTRQSYIKLIQLNFYIAKFCMVNKIQNKFQNVKKPVDMAGFLFYNQIIPFW